MLTLAKDGIRGEASERVDAERDFHSEAVKAAEILLKVARDILHTASMVQGSGNHRTIQDHRNICVNEAVRASSQVVRTFC